jgi:hypothetical protein
VTIAYPDVSNHEGSMLLQPATVAACAKASEGTGYTDPFYGHYKAEAGRVGALFFAYHFLHAGNGAAQADHCFSVTGPGVNVMIDHEPTKLPDGTLSQPTVQDALDFAVRYRARGGLCTLAYLPHWYWANPIGSPAGGMGSPSLTPLAAAGLSLISSNYTGYSDTGPGWAPYGGLSPVIWQYTDALPYSGQSVDFNAYRGTVADLQALLGYTEDDMTPDQANQLQQVYSFIFEGGTDSGPIPPGAPNNSLVSQLAYVQETAAALQAPDPAAFVAALAANPAALAALAAVLPKAPTVDQIAAAVAVHFSGDLKQG